MERTKIEEWPKGVVWEIETRNSLVINEITFPIFGYKSSYKITNTKLIEKGSDHCLLFTAASKHQTQQ